MMNLIREALKIRLCLADLTFERECEEQDEDANQQFQKLKEANLNLHVKFSELNGAMHKVVLELKPKNTPIESKVKKNKKQTFGSRLFLQSISSLPVQIKQLKTPKQTEIDSDSGSESSCLSGSSAMMSRKYFMRRKPYQRIQSPNQNLIGGRKDRSQTSYAQMTWFTK